MHLCTICGEDWGPVVKFKICGEMFCVDCGEESEKLSIYCLNRENNTDVGFSEYSKDREYHN